MKFSKINIERFGSRRQVLLNRLSEQLTVVVDPLAEENLLGRFVSQVCFGTNAPPSNASWTASDETGGWLEVISGGSAFRLSRPSLDSRHMLLITPLDSTQRAAVLNIPRSLDAQVFETFFGWPHHRPPTLPEMADVVNRKFGDRSDDAAWVASSNAHGRPLEYEHRWAELTAEQNRLNDRLNQHLRRAQAESQSTHDWLAQLSANIEQCDARIRAANSRRDLLDRQTIELRSRPKVILPVAPPGPQNASPDQAALLYERLDEIDGQWRMWRDVQQTIQQRRVEIRDELSRATELSMDSPNHPFDRARQLLGELETLLSETVARGKPARDAAASGLGAASQRIDEAQRVLQALGHELQQQCRQVRHRTSAAELKQLRGCYNELEESVKRLLRRRQSIIEQLHALDPEGAEMVLRGSQSFCQLAQQEGYLAARNRFAPATIPFPHSAISATDPPSDQWQLESLRQQRDAVQSEIAQSEADLRRLVSQRDQTIDQCNRHMAGERELRMQLERVESELRCQVAHSRTPAASPIERSHVGPTPAPAIVQRAGQYFQKLSVGQWSGAHWDAHRASIVALDRFAKATSVSALDRVASEQLAWGMCLAVADYFRERGESLPLVLSGLLEGTAEHDRDWILSALQAALAAGHQVIVVVRRSADAGYFASLRPTVINLANNPNPASAWQSSMTLADSHTFREPTIRSSSSLPPALQTAAAPSYRAIESPSEPLNRFPINRSAYMNRSAPATPLQPVSSNERHGNELTLSSPIRDAGIWQTAEIAALNRCRIFTFADLLNADPDTLASSLAEQRLTFDQIRHWQACCWLLVCVPEMAAEDARILVECGIDSPDQLEEVRGELLLRRISERLAATGRSSAIGCYNVERINGWMRSLARTRPTWKQINRPRRTMAVPATIASAAWQTPILAAPIGSPTLATSANSSSTTSDVFENVANRRPMDGDREALRFHLNLNDSVDAAPSIGSRVFQQLAQLGVRTVRDFLNRSPDDIARQLGNRRISGSTVEQWQQQAKIACSVPNLRRHDAQILVACGITDPNKLAAYEANELFDVVNRFVRSKAGMRMIRSAKKPDLAEVTDWIRWARHNRTLQAA